MFKQHGSVVMHTMVGFGHDQESGKKLAACSVGSEGPNVVRRHCFGRNDSRHRPARISSGCNPSFSMIYGTTPSGAKLKPAVIISPRGERAMRAFAHLTDRVHILQGYRWFGVEMWSRYIEQ